MKNSSEYAARFKQLCNRLRRTKGKPAESTPGDPMTEIILACLSAHTTESKARTALNKLRSTFVDFNELRVCRPDEISDAVGKNFPAVKEVAAQITTLLQQLCARNNTLNLDFLGEGSKRDARLFLESLPGITPYVVARVMLLSLQAHAFPVHEQMLQMLRKEEVVAPEAEAAVVQSFIEHHVPASKIRMTYALLRRHADGIRPSRAGVAKPAAAKKNVKKTKKNKKTTKKRKN